MTKQDGQQTGALDAETKPNGFAACSKSFWKRAKVVPVIDRRYSLSELPDALRYFGEGHAKGKIVITIP